MRIPPPRQDRGIALIIVMMVIIVLSVLAGGFAYSMKVETKLARNTSWEAEMEWLGRSGVELGKYSLATYLMGGGQEAAYTGLDQVWAGGPFNETNELVNVQLKDVKIGPGKVTVTMQDLERKFNLSVINENTGAILERALLMCGADAADIPTIMDSYFDWVDPDHKTHLAGAENKDYLQMPTPYYAKNGFVDDIRELLLIKGMTEQVFWGTKRVGDSPEQKDRSGGPGRLKRPMSPHLQAMEANQSTGVGLVDLFVPYHGMGNRVNVNTASAEVLQLVPGLDEALAGAIVANRSAGPYLNPSEALLQAGADAAMVGSMQNLLTVQSRVFEITVDAEIGNYKRRFVALVERRDRNNVTILYFTWK